VGKASHGGEQRPRILSSHPLGAKAFSGPLVADGPFKQVERFRGVDGCGALNAAQPLVRIAGSEHSQGDIQSEACLPTCHGSR
jgi:hypothetical protein